MNKITIELTEDQAKHMQEVLKDKVLKDKSAFSTRIYIKLSQALVKAKS